MIRPLSTDGIFCVHLHQHYCVLRLFSQRCLYLKIWQIEKAGFNRLPNNQNLSEYVKQNP
jgi:hypothetical protein